MSYVKARKGLGLDPVLATMTLSQPSSSTSAELDFVNSLPPCSVSGVSVSVTEGGTAVRDHRNAVRGVRYSSVYQQTPVCVTHEEALARRRLDNRKLREGAFLSPRDSQGNLNKNYLILLLKAQGSPEVRTLAKKVGVTLYPEIGQKIAPSPLHLSMLKNGILRMETDLGKKIQRDNLKNALAGIAFHLSNRVGGAEAPAENVAEHRAQVLTQACASIGLPPALIPCCTEFVSKRGASLEEYKQKLEKQDPEVMACIEAVATRQAENAAAKKQRTMILAAGAVAAAAVGITILKKRKKRKS